MCLAFGQILTEHSYISLRAQSHCMSSSPPLASSKAVSFNAEALTSNPFTGPSNETHSGQSLRRARSRVESTTSMNGPTTLLKALMRTLLATSHPSSSHNPAPTPFLSAPCPLQWCVLASNPVLLEGRRAGKREPGRLLLCFCYSLAELAMRATGELSHPNTAGLH